MGKSMWVCEVVRKRGKMRGETVAPRDVYFISARFPEFRESVSTGERHVRQYIYLIKSE